MMPRNTSITRGDVTLRSRSARLVEVDYYDSGQFGEAGCEHCGALMLKGENEKIKRGRVTQCCASGDVHTQQMKTEFEELQKPPEEYTKGLINASNQKTREAFLDNTMPFNNTFAFASVHGEKAPEDQMGGRLDTCKYNGEFSFQFSDLIAPGGRRPTFAQVYTLTPEAAMNIRDENFSTALSPPVKAEILRKLEELMRANPFGRTFETAGAKIKAAKAATGEIPRFQIALLTDRDLKTDALKNRGDVTIIERADAPTAKQVAVIWVQEDGLAPEISAFWVCDKAGRMRELKSGMPQLDPCCFPLLHPRGTPGWRWFIKKRGRKREEVHMQDALDNSMAEEVAEPRPNEPNAGASDHQEDDEMPEEALELDKEVPEEEENNACREEDPVMEPENIDGSSKKSNISERQFYRYRMALRGDDKNAFHWLWFARRLAEYFTISVLNRIERNDMDHLKAIQTKKNYRQLLARDYIAAMEKGLQKLGRNAKLGRVFLMPQTFAGSRQYYQGKYADLMTMVRHLGAPTWFVTFTGNPKWPEIAEALRGRQNYAHRPDIVCRIFMDKATEFIKDLTERHVLGKVAGQ
uniref:Helitron_like_N domain-containing protein n=1 Tax=Globodera pallida TaxID=36090 RepID=A0A183BT27_GLOPA